MFSLSSVIDLHWSGWRGERLKNYVLTYLLQTRTVFILLLTVTVITSTVLLFKCTVCLFPYQHTDSIGNAEYTLVGIHICIHLGCFDSHAGIYDFHRIHPHLCIWERSRTWNNYINIYVVKYVTHFEDQPNTSICDIVILFWAVEAICLESLMLNSYRVLPINQ